MSNNFFFRTLSALILAPLIVYSVIAGGWFFILFLLIIFLLGIYEIIKIKNLIIKFIIFSLLVIFLFVLFQISILQNGRLYLVLILLITWLSDIGGYIFGKLFRGPNIKVISPNKTYSGFLGSILFTQLLLFFFERFNLNLHFDYPKSSLFLFFCSLIVISGDLLFSYFKRVSMIKDFSNFIPGHGGIFDRIDGLILLTIFFYFYLKVII